MTPHLIPAFLQGMGSVLELYPTDFRYPIQRLAPHLNDAQRLANDWERVGLAMRNAIEQAPSLAATVEEQEEPAARE